jgi:hypothetical protein
MLNQSVAPDGAIVSPVTQFESAGIPVWSTNRLRNSCRSPTAPLPASVARPAFNVHICTRKNFKICL